MINLLGLAARARKLTYWTEITIKGVRSGRVKLVFLANDASNNTKKLVSDKSSHYNVVVIDDFDSIEMSNAVGKNNIRVLGVTDDGFSKSLLSRKRKWILWPKNKIEKSNKKITRPVRR